MLLNSFLFLIFFPRNFFLSFPLIFLIILICDCSLYQIFRTYFYFTKFDSILPYFNFPIAVLLFQGNQ